MIKQDRGMIYGPDECYLCTDEGKTELRTLKVVPGEIFAFQKVDESLVALYVEDDGTLHKKIEFNKAWLDDLEGALREFRRVYGV